MIAQAVEKPHDRDRLNFEGRGQPTVGHDLRALQNVMLPLPKRRRLMRILFGRDPMIATSPEYSTSFIARVPSRAAAFPIACQIFRYSCTVSDLRPPAQAAATETSASARACCALARPNNPALYFARFRSHT